MNRQPAAVWRVCMMGALGALPFLCHAQVDQNLPEVKVSAPRKTDPDDGSTVRTTRITAQQMTERQVVNIKDVADEEPGVSVANRPTRFGTSSFNIRGVDENRILMQVDGVRMQESFKIGAYSNAPRDMVDIELLEAITITRGTGSPREGSDALGGSVAYTTPNPEDLLKGQSVAFRSKSMHQTVDRSNVQVLTGAAGNDMVKVLARGVWRKGHESKTAGDVAGVGYSRTVANPQDTDSDAALFKLALTPTAGYRAQLSYQHSDRDVYTDQLSSRQPGVLGMKDWDEYRHELLSLDQQLKGTPLGEVVFKLYQQRTRVGQYAWQLHNGSASSSPNNTHHYDRFFDYQQEMTGARTDVETRLSDHMLRWGVEVSRTQSIQLRDGNLVRNNGAVEKQISGVDYPARDFPPSDTHRGALYAQDLWYLSDDLTLDMALRYERYHLNPSPDAIYLSSADASQTTDAKFHNLAPKLGAIWQLGQGYSLHGQYAHGFRAPPFNDVNIGFSNVNHGYVVVPNPNLTAETSRGVEASLRHQQGGSSWSFTVFDNRYREFIDTVDLDCDGVGSDDPSCSPSGLATNQARNIPRVRINGAEARFTQALSSAWSVSGHLAYARGRNTRTNAPIYSVNPMSGRLALGYRSDAWNLELSSSFAKGKNEKDAEGSNRLFLPSGYAVYDLRGSWQASKNVQVVAGLYNLFDRVYYQWSDVPIKDGAHDPETIGGQQRYSRPGRHGVISLVLNY